MDRKERKERYKTSEAEEAILNKYKKLYAECDKRTCERTKLNADCLEELHALGPEQREHWTMTNSRQWFTNNKKGKKNGKNQDDGVMERSVMLPPAPVATLKRTNAIQLALLQIAQKKQEVQGAPPPSPVVQRSPEKVDSLPAPPKHFDSESSRVAFNPQGQIIANREISFNLEDGPPKPPTNDLDVTIRDQHSRPMSRTLSRTMSNGYTILDKMGPNVAQQARKEEPKLVIPPVLTAKERHSSNAKMTLIACLQNYHQTGKEIAAVEKELARGYQKELEDNFVQTIRYLVEVTDKVWVPCPNRHAEKVSSTLEAKFRRQHSCTTQIYSGMNDYMNTENPKPVGLFTRVSPSESLPRDLPETIKCMYMGQFQERFTTNIGTPKLCEISSNNCFIVACDNESVVLRNNTASITLEFDPNNIFYDTERDRVWLTTESTIYGYKGDTLEHFDTLSTEGTVSCMAFWGDRIVAAVGNELFAWHMEPLDEDRDGQRSGMSLGYDIELEKITSVAAVGDYIIVADSDYPVAHVYYRRQVGNEVWTRLVSHTLGINILLGFHGQQIFTGSGDRLSYLWDLETGKCVTMFMRHGDAVVDLDCHMLCDTLILFSVGTDCIRVWDIKRKRWMFDILTGEGLIAKKARFEPETGTLQVLAVGEQHSEIQTFVFNKV